MKKLLALLLILPNLTYAAIAFDKSGTQTYNGGGTNNAAVNVAATASDEVAIITSYGGKGDGSDPNMTATVDGNSATFIDKQIIDTGGGTGAYLYFFWFPNPSTSSVEYKVTGNGVGDYIIQPLLYSGADTSSQPDSYNSSQVVGDVTATTTVVTDQSWLVSMCRNTNVGPCSAGTGTTIRGTPGTYAAGDSNAAVGTGSQSMTWTTAGVGQTGEIIISLKPAAVAGGADIPVPQEMISITD